MRNPRWLTKWPPKTYKGDISGTKQAKRKILVSTSRFLRSRNSFLPLWNLYDMYLSEKFKMADKIANKNNLQFGNISHFENERLVILEYKSIHHHSHRGQLCPFVFHKYIELGVQMHLFKRIRNWNRVQISQILTSKIGQREDIKRSERS